MKRVFSGLLLVVISTFIWLGAGPSISDVTLIRTIDGELVHMKLLEKQTSYLSSEDFLVRESKFQSWLTVDNIVARKTSHPTVQDLIFYHHVLGQPEVATRFYTYLVANAALSNSYFGDDVDGEREERSLQNRQIIEGIVQHSFNGNSDASWAIAKIKEERGVDLLKPKN